MTVYTLRATVLDVFEKQELTKSWKNPDGTVENRYRKDGWYLKIKGVSFYLGEEKPDFNVGDEVKIRISNA